MDRTEKTDWIEKGPGFGAGLSGLREALGIKTASAGLVAAIFGCSGPALIVIGAANNGGLTEGQTVAWLLAIYGLGGLISLIMALYYKLPVTGAYSIPGAALVAGALGTFPFEQAVGAFFLSMRFLRAVPPVLTALVVGLVAVTLTGGFQGGEAAISFVAPEFTAPVFTLDAFLAIAVPLAVLVIGAENAQAIGVLYAEGYRPPINAMTVISGIGGMLAGVIGGHNANIAGPMTAICSSDQAGENPERRYAATVLNGVLFAAFGIFAGVAVPLIMALPGPLIGAVAGLAMITVLLSAFQSAFDRNAGHQIGAFVALIVAMSNVSFLSISAPFWALAAGAAVSVLNERAVRSQPVATSAS